MYSIGALKQGFLFWGILPGAISKGIPPGRISRVSVRIWTTGWQTQTVGMLTLADLVET